MMGPYLERTGVSQNLRIEVAVTVHRLLEDLDRACQRADLVAPIGMRNLDAFSAFGDCLMVAVIAESGRATEREMIRTPTQTRTSANPPRPRSATDIERLSSV